jgi:hypothetical protein
MMVALAAAPVFLFARDSGQVSQPPALGLWIGVLTSILGALLS